MSVLYNLLIPGLGIYFDQATTPPVFNSPFLLPLLVLYILEGLQWILALALVTPFWRTHRKYAMLHANLKRLNCMSIFHVLIFVCLRIMIFPYQLGWIPVTGSWYKDCVWIVAHLTRRYHIYFCYSIQLTSVIERLIATLFVRDYESNKRPYISVILALYVVTFSIGAAVTMNSAAAYPIGLIVMASHLGSTITKPGGMMILWSFLSQIFTGVWAYNGHLERKLRLTTSDYSLPARYQVKENLRSFKLLRNMILPGIPVALTCLCTGYISMRQPIEIYILIRALIDFLMTSSQVISLVLGMYAMPEWKEAFFKAIRPCSAAPSQLSAPRTPPVIPPLADEGRVYFNQLRLSWQ